MPSEQRSGLSATVGLAMVIGLLLVAGTLAVSGGGILNSGGRLGLNPEASASSAPHEDGVAASGDPIASGATADPGIETPSVVTGQAFDYTCAAAGIRDATRSKWQLGQFLVGERPVVGERPGFERITWPLTKRDGKSKKATEVTIEWMDTRAAQEQFDMSRLAGQRAIVVTFDGPVDITADQAIDKLFLEGAGVEMIRYVRMFDGEDGKVRTVIGLRGDGCAKMIAPNFKKKNGNAKKAKIFLDIERPAPAGE